MTEGAGELLRIGEVEHFIRGVRIRKRATYPECNDLRVGIDAFQLLQERNRASFTI